MTPAPTLDPSEGLCPEPRVIKGSLLHSALSVLQPSLRHRPDPEADLVRRREAQPEGIQSPAQGPRGGSEGVSERAERRGREPEPTPPKLSEAMVTHVR